MHHSLRDKLTESRIYLQSGGGYYQPATILPTRVVMSNHRTSRLLCNRKSIRSFVIISFMCYVMLSLHELCNQRLNVQLLLDTDNKAFLLDDEQAASTHPRKTRAVRTNHIQAPHNYSQPQEAALEERKITAPSLFPDSLEKVDTNNVTINEAQSNDLRLDDVHISVKTSKKFHRQRLDVILRTWFTEAAKQTYFVTDDEDAEYQEKTNGHLIDSKCSNSHHRKALCCKMAVELDFFLLMDKKWFCHFDDDNYVNVDSLLDLLSQHDAQQDWYLGKPSIKAPLEIPYLKKKSSEGGKATFWFATGGAGFCLSRSLVQRMQPVVSNGKFMGLGEKIRLPDDVTIGYVIEYLLGVPLTVVDRFHSHLEPLQVLPVDTLKNQISFSYSTYRGNQMNRVTIPGWDLSSDPTRFFSLFCYLSPALSRKCPPAIVQV